VLIQRKPGRAKYGTFAGRRLIAPPFAHVRTHELVIGLFVVVAIAAVIVWIADYTSVPRDRIEEMKNRGE
jgi:hypothetical protein